MKEIDYDKNALKDDNEFLEEYVEDFKNASKVLEDIGACVAIYGSARFNKSNYYYKEAYKLSALLSQNGFNILSGGSGGIMEAANRGCFDTSTTESVGINLKLPFEQKTNKYVTKTATLRSFGVRKHFLMKDITSCIVFPGGFGTLDELFEVMALVQTKKSLPISIHLVGYNFWQPLVEYMKTTLAQYEVISPSDVNILKLGDNLEEIARDVRLHVNRYLEVMKSIGLEDSKRYKLIKEQFKME
ncbi:MAG: TIGR00730 family Rossman fold protein [Campylobacteraceae bacterium]